jgi:hypothetical protein
MKWPNPDKLMTFVDSITYPSISLYMPTHIYGEEIKQDPIQFKNLINDSRAVLEKTYPHEKAVEILKPAYDLQSDFMFWQHQNRGLAMFITPDYSEYINLSVSPRASFHVGHYFHILPLVDAFRDNGSFYFLVLSQHIVKLFFADHYTKTEIELQNVPKNIEELLRFDISEDNIMARSLPRGSISGKGAMYYGSADLKLNKRNIDRYVQIIAQAVDKKLFNQNLPLIVAAVEYEESMFRMHCTYPHLISKSIYGNPDQVKADSVHNQAWDIIADFLKKDEEKYTKLYNDFSDTDKTSTDIKQILEAGYMGRIDTLFVNTNKHSYGKFDTKSLNIEMHEQQEENDEDLLNLAAIYTLKTEGKVFPYNRKLWNQSALAAAIFRY